MFAYCNNNPVNRIDVSGGIPLIATMAIGAAVNVGTSYVTSKVMGQDFTCGDVIVATFSGGVGALGGGYTILAGTVNGGYEMYKANKDGSSQIGIFATGITAFATTVVTAPNVLASKNLGVSDVISGIYDSVFGIPANAITSTMSLFFPETKDATISAAEYKKLTFKESQLDSSPKKSNISHAEYKKRTFKETQLDPRRKNSTITQSEYKRLTFMESRLA